MKKNKKKILVFVILGILILARIIIQLESKPEIDAIPGSMKMVSENEHVESKDKIDSRLSALLSSQCSDAQLLFADIQEVKKIKTSSTRYVNTHKSIDGVIYRFRFFYKETSENEVPQYLLYQEDEAEEDHLIEVSPYKKGLKYLKFEIKNGETIYIEEGLNVGTDQNLFLHYENGQLKKIQGPFEKKILDCTY